MWRYDGENFISAHWSLIIIDMNDTESMDTWLTLSALREWAGGWH